MYVRYLNPYPWQKFLDKPSGRAERNHSLLTLRNNWIYEQEAEDIKRLAKAFRTEMLFFEADDLSMKIIEYYQRYLKRKEL